MRINDVKASPRRFDHDPLRRTGLGRGVELWNASVANRLARKAAQECIAEVSRAASSGGDVKEAHTESFRQKTRLVEPAAALLIGVELLQAGDVGTSSFEHAKDAFGIEPAIDATAAVDVVGEDSNSTRHAETNVSATERVATSTMRRFVPSVRSEARESDANWPHRAMARGR